MTYQKVTLAPFPKGDVRKKIIKDTEFYKNNPQPEDGLRHDLRKKKAIAEASDNGRCWWIAQYLRHSL